MDDFPEKIAFRNGMQIIELPNRAAFLSAALDTEPPNMGLANWLVVRGAQSTADQQVALVTLRAKAQDKVNAVLGALLQVLFGATIGLNAVKYGRRQRSMLCVGLCGSSICLAVSTLPGTRC